MPRSVITTITALDYKDFKQEYSEKNIINQTNGNEFIIETASASTIADINEDNPKEISVSPLTTNSQVSERDYAQVVIEGILGGLFNKTNVYLRDEWYLQPISFSIETEEVLADTNINNISIKTTIYYDKYKAINGDVETDPYRFVSADNWKSWYSIYAQLLRFPSSESGLIASENLPFQHSRCQKENSEAENDNSYTSWQFPENSLKIKSCEKQPNGNYKIYVEGKLCTWWGYNHTRANKYEILEEIATVLVATRVEFTISANTITEREIAFNYSRNLINNRANAQGRNYALESNEFIQTDENTTQNSRTSFLISQEIFDKFDQDRSIVSFILLNCEKYQVGGTYRYLRSEDLIYLEDENGELISDEINANGELVPSIFEIIKTRPIWDGSFSMEVVCRKIDMTT